MKGCSRNMKRLFNLEHLPFFNVKDWPSSSSSKIWSASPATVTASENGYESDVFTESVQAKKKTKRKRYVGDLTSSDFSTSEKRKRNFRLMKDTILRQRKLLQNKQRLIRYFRNRIQTQKEFLDMLTQKFNMNASTESELKACLSGPASQIFERMLKGPSTQKCDPVLRSFAVTLAFYSPKAYTFVRNPFNKSLPDLSIISKWYKSVNGSPGFTQEALETLKILKRQADAMLCAIWF
ncbi:unnamed protein product [Acanthoscelides obtectus]|uniref:THAP9-like helix-turn-helix domain-containing protein n=1 Tax=Acanthoscelides obtectus TaxID=200917 RepID=A0A9P0PA69_ACAOB|nr:unnamed protein product [Acanthoscelides obtectus]CAK1655839.1 hypothetical protein AOBTE_LOCUS19379 [Acanthoscelides obtectus]